MSDIVSERPYMCNTHNVCACVVMHVGMPVCVLLVVCVVLPKGLCISAMHVFELSAVRRSGQRRLSVAHSSGSKAQPQWQNGSAAF